MSAKGVIASILVVIFLGLMIFAGSKVVDNQRFIPDAGGSSSSSSSSSSAFTSRLKGKTPDETLSSPLSSLETKTLQAGTGDRTVKTGDNITVNYIGWFANNGNVFDQSFNHGDSGFPFTVGQGVITGWSQGVVGMKQGEVRRLKIPYSLAYGEQGNPPTIPAKSDLIFDVELISFN